jgi:hypothetical protein
MLFMLFVIPVKQVASDGLLSSADCVVSVLQANVIAKRVEKFIFFCTRF